MNTPIGVPVVTWRPLPSSIITPERMRASSGSRRWVVNRDAPGRRRSSSAWMSATANRNPRRAPVDDASYSRAMTFAEGGDAKKMPETVVGHSEPDARYIRTAIRAVKPQSPRRTGSQGWKQCSFPIHLRWRIAITASNTKNQTTR